MKTVLEYVDEYNYLKDIKDKAEEKAFKQDISEENRKGQFERMETYEEKMNRLKTLCKLEHPTVTLYREAQKARQIFSSYCKSNIMYYDTHFDKF